MIDDEKDIWVPQWPPNTQPSFVYHKPTFGAHLGKSGNTWLVPAITVLPNRADHIYVTAYPDPEKTGKGFAGAIMHMPLLTGRDFILRGGWHSRADALLEDTGLDVRNSRLTYGAVGLHRSGSWLVGLLHYDESPQLGYHDRIPQLAQKLANERNESVFYSFLSAGGGASGRKEVTS